jgi:hypothetical protein
MEFLQSLIEMLYQFMASLGMNPANANFGNPFTIFFGGGFLCGGMGALLGAGILSIKTLLAMRWPTAPGVVVATRIDSSSDSEGTSYSPVVVYQYQVGERAYQNDLLAFGAKNYSGGYGGAERTIRKYPVGAGVRVFYNPGNPQKSVLEVRAASGPLLIFLGVLFSCIGIVGGFMGAF